MGPTSYPGLAGNITGMPTGRVASADSALLYRPSAPPLYNIHNPELKRAKPTCSPPPPNHTALPRRFSTQHRSIQNAPS